MTTKGGIEKLPRHQFSFQFLRAAGAFDESGGAHEGRENMDVLHVATALTLGATEFLTFDFSQAVLARAEGVNVNP